MQRWFRISGTIALIGLLASGFSGLAPSLNAQENPPAEAEEETVLKGFDPQDLPTPGKHQLKPTPLQIANHRIMRLAERIAAQSERVIALEKTVAAQKEQIAQQQQELEARAKTTSNLEARLQAMFDQIATVSKQVEQVEEHQSRTARRAERQEPSVRHNSEAIPRAQAVSPEELARLRQQPRQSEQEAPSAPPAPTPTPVQPPPPGSTVYTIKRGDNLTNIARAHGTTVTEIQKINAIGDERKLQIGQQLYLPPGASQPEGQASPQSSPSAPSSSPSPAATDSEAPQS